SPTPPRGPQAKKTDAAAALAPPPPENEAIASNRNRHCPGMLTSALRWTECEFLLIVQQQRAAGSSDRVSVLRKLSFKVEMVRPLERRDIYQALAGLLQYLYQQRSGLCRRWRRFGFAPGGYDLDPQFIKIVLP